MDLYLSLSPTQQTDLGTLERIFEDHFRPMTQGYMGMAEILKMCKAPRESISEYYLRVRQFADRLNVAPEMIKYAYVQGLPREYQKHLQLAKHVIELEDIHQESIDFENASALDRKPVGPQTNIVENGDVKRLEAKFDRLMNKVTQWRQETNSAPRTEKGYETPIREKKDTINFRRK